MKEHDFTQFVLSILADPNDVKKTLSVEDIESLQTLASKFVELSEELDKVKRSIFYQKGKDPNLEYPKGDYPELTNDQINLLHSSVGMVTESVEIFENVIKVFSTGMDGTNLAEELGDQNFYWSAGVYSAGLLPYQVRDIVHKKLVVRYGDGFSNNKALTRNLAAEKVAMEDAIDKEQYKIERGLEDGS